MREWSSFLHRPLVRKEAGKFEMGPGEINKDLVKERAGCSFDVTELTNLIDGGKDKTARRKEIEEIVLNIKELQDEVPDEFLSPKEKYESSIKKSCILSRLIMDKFALDYFGEDSRFLFQTVYAYIKDMSPFTLHLGMFVPTILGQGTQEQQDYWLPRMLSMNIIGTYAQTELGHGTFLRGLETTATYDPEKQEFVLHSPTLSSYKWWPGGLGHTANYCVVLAQLYTKGQCHGIHPFVIQIRDEETHMPLPGINVGDIGPKMGFNTVNNGFLGFDNFRVSRDAMLMKNSQVLPDGTFVKSANEKLTYGTMVLIRVSLVKDSAFHLSRAATIATRYSAVRHQSQPKPGEPEPQIIDYMTQQHKLFINMATCFAFSTVGDYLIKKHKEVEIDIKRGSTDKLPELHALASCLKAVSTSDAASGIEKCRLACGGHGYMLSSNFPVIYALATAMNTYEGENTVMLLQTARYLIKVWDHVELRNWKALTPTVSYLGDVYKTGKVKWENTPEAIVRGFQAVAAGKLAACAASIREHVKTGMAYEDAWALTTVQLVGAAEAHCRAFIVEGYWSETQRVAPTVSPNLRTVLHNLAELYLVYWAIERTGDLLLFSSLSGKDATALQKRYERLLSLIRPNAVAIVDAFDIRDEIISSTLGSYDGRVYERLMETAKKSPLNSEPVNQSFHKYLKPFMQGKL